MRELTSTELDQEIERREKDLAALKEAHEKISSRIRESEITPNQLLPLHEWSGAMGLQLIMEPIVHAMEKVVSELRQEREKIKDPERGLRLITTQEDSDGS